MFIPFAIPGWSRNSLSACLALSFAARARSKPSSDRPPDLSEALPIPRSDRPFERSDALPNPPPTPPPRPPIPELPPPPPRPRPWASAFMQAPKINNETRPKESNLTTCLDFITYLQVFLDFNVKGEFLNRTTEH